MILAGSLTRLAGRCGRSSAGVAAAALVGVLALSGGLAGCNPPAPASGSDPPARAKPTHERVLADTSAAIVAGEASTRDPIQSVIVPLELLSLYVERARLTGNYDDYARAEALLARLPGPSLATDRVCLAKAKLHYSLHRLALAKTVLDGCPTVAGTVEDLGLRADIAFYSGRYKDAATIYRALVNQAGTPQTYIQLALYSAKTGSPGEALAFLEAAEKRYHGGSAILQSWLALQRGLVELDRGRYDEARALFTLADERLPGHWLNEEHLAEIASLKGDRAAAKRLYETVVRKTGAPEYLDALGAIEAEAGNTQAARQLLTRAEAAYTERAKRFPEAIAGHALDHYLSAAPDPTRALTLAKANFANRPHGDAAIGLAKAQLFNGQAKAAAALLEQQIALGWDTAELYWTLSLAAKAAGDATRTKTAGLEALRRNPQSATQYAFKS